MTLFYSDFLCFFLQTSSELSTTSNAEAFIMSYVLNSETVTTFEFGKFRDDKYTFLFRSFKTKSDFFIVPPSDFSEC